MKPETLGRDAASITLVAIMLTLVLVFVSISIFIPIASAEITELNVEPDVVGPGEVVTISGKAAPNEEVWISSSFELTLPVAADGRYSREFKDIHFLKGKKDFFVQAENIKNIHASLCCVWGQTVTITCSGQTMTISVPGITKTCPLGQSIDETGVARFSISFPVSIGGLTNIYISGKKDIAIDGDAAEDATSVNLKVATTLKSFLRFTPFPEYPPLADSNGNFHIEVDTEGIPPGEFLISAKGIDGETMEETVYIGVTPTPTPTPSPSPSPTPTPTSSSTETSTPSPTPSPSPSPSPSPTLSPTPSPSTSPSPTPTSTSTPTPTATPALTATPTPSAPAPTSTPSPTPSPSSSKRWIPGFDAVFAIAGLLAVAYLVLRKKGQENRK